MNDFKIYIPVQNEECLIEYTVEALKKVFDPSLIEVLDLESTDSTVSKVPSDVKVTTIVLPKSTMANPSITGAAYTKMKSDYCKKQKWVLWVDGDEIYPVRTSLAIVEWLKRAEAGNTERQANRLYWRMLKEEGGRKYQSVEFLSAGGKVFNSEYQEFRRAWPRETFHSLKDTNRFVATHKSKFNGLWFWHGVLLKRSHQAEPTWRRKKRMVKEGRYNAAMTWKEIDKWPWEIGYESEIITDWTVVSPNSNHPGIDRWEGRL
jgi:hypothetical protein